MEVHQHTQTERKKWYHYFRELPSQKNYLIR